MTLKESFEKIKDQLKCIKPNDLGDVPLYITWRDRTEDEKQQSIQRWQKRMIDENVKKEVQWDKVIFAAEWIDKLFEKTDKSINHFGFGFHPEGSGDSGYYEEQMMWVGAATHEEYKKTGIDPPWNMSIQKTTIAINGSENINAVELDGTEFCSALWNSQPRVGIYEDMMQLLENEFDTRYGGWENNDGGTGNIALYLFRTGEVVFDLDMQYYYTKTSDVSAVIE